MAGELEKFCLGSENIRKEKLRKLVGTLERGLLGFLPMSQLLALGQTPAEGVTGCTVETFLGHLSVWPVPRELECVCM